LNHVINYYGINNGDQLKSSIIDLYKLPNDLRYLNNGVQMTEQEVAKNQKWIDFNNDEVMKVAAGGLLQKFIYIEIDKNVAAMVTNSPSTFNFNLYNSTIYEFKDAAETLSDTEWKKIKDVQVTNNTNFTIHQSAFYIQRETKKVFFIAKVSIKNVGDYNFLSLAQKDTGNFLDRYSDHILKSANTSLLSKMELREKVDALSERYKELPNYNSYLLM
jgi:hypothetical protein